MSWDWIISATILIWFGLVIASRVTRQTIPELIAGIKESLVGGAEESIDYATEVYD